MKQRVLSSSSEYLVSGHAKTFLSTAGSQKAIDPAKLDQLSQQLARDGYVILESVVPVEQIERIENELHGLLQSISCQERAHSRCIMTMLFTL